MFQTEFPEKMVRDLIRTRTKAVLATMMRNKDREPYASLTLSACDQQGRPLIFVSDIAEHTKNLRNHATASLLYEATEGRVDPLSGPRVSLQGVWEVVEDPSIKERFFRRHETARRYEQAHGFNLFRMTIQRAHLIAGFGLIHWFEGSKVLYSGIGMESIPHEENRILDHMNDDHPEALDLYANALLSEPGNGWKMIGIDPEGFDLRLHDKVIRLEFDSPVAHAEEAREKLVALIKQARAPFHPDREPSAVR